jgi:hypothetical protein
MPKQFDADVVGLLNGSEEVEIETQTTPQDPVRRTIIWVVVDGGEVFVRSVRGARGRWYRRIAANPVAALYAGGRHIPVRAFPAADERSIARASAAYQQKYKGDPSTPSMVRDEVLQTTLRLEPTGA